MCVWLRHSSRSKIDMHLQVDIWTSFIINLYRKNNLTETSISRLFLTTLLKAFIPYKHDYQTLNSY